MDYTVKLAYQSNYWYNDGLAKAQVRDMSGAITSLKKSLQYNRATWPPEIFWDLSTTGVEM